jgi:hypothetical protein
MLRRSERIADLAKRRLAAATAITKPAPRSHRRRHVHRYALPSLPVLGCNESEDWGGAPVVKLPKGAKWPKGTIQVTIEVPPELGWLEFGDELQIAGDEADEEKKEKADDEDDDDDDDNEEEED